MRAEISTEIRAEAALVVRTDYSDEDVWRRVMTILNAPAFGDLALKPINHFVDDPCWDGATTDEVLAAVPDARDVVFLADARTMRAPYPLIAVNTVTREECEDNDEYTDEMAYGQEFRVLPAGVCEVNVNLCEANMDFPEFALLAQRDPTGCVRPLFT